MKVACAYLEGQDTKKVTAATKDKALAYPALRHTLRQTSMRLPLDPARWECSSVSRHCYCVWSCGAAQMQYVVPNVACLV